MSRRIGGSFWLSALMTATISATAAWWLTHAGASGHAQWVFGLGLLALFVNLALGYLVVRWIKHQIGCEPAYATWVAKKISLGNLAIDIESTTGHQTSLLAAIVAMRDSLAEIVSHARSGADSVAQASNSLANVNLDLASKTEQQINSLVSTMTALDALTSAVKLNSASIGQAHAMVSDAVKAASDGGAAMSMVVTTMSLMSAASKKVVDIIGVINSIAFQTNILALNAAVEAARAGEQGKGFAVVASEVRSLASRSGEAAKEIEALIRNSVQQINQGEKLVQDAGRRMQELVGTVHQVNQVMGDIDAETQKQGQAIENINTAVVDIQALLQENAILVQRAASSAESMQDQAGSLAQVVSVFKLKVGMTTGAASTSPVVDTTAATVSMSSNRNASGFQPRLIRFGYGLATESNQGRAARFFANDLAKRTGGRLKLKEFGDAALGNDDAMQEAMIAGQLEMMVGSTTTLVKYAPDLSVFDLPFLFGNEAQADAVLDGELGQRLAAQLTQQGIQGLVYWENGFRHLTNSKRPVSRMEDLKGINLRVMQNPVYIQMFSAFGSNAVPLPFAELFAAMESGQVDGQENPVNTIQSCKFYEVQKYLSLTKHVYSPWIVTASHAWWKRLSSEERAAVQASAEASRTFEREDSRRSTENALKFLREQGMQVTHISDAELARMRQKIQGVLKSSGHAEKLDWVNKALGSV